PPLPPSPTPPPAPLRPAAATPPIPTPEFVVEHASEEPVARELTAPAPPAGDIEVFDGALDFDAAAHGTAKAEGLEVQEEVELKAQDLAVEGLAHTQFESVLAAPPEPEQELPAVDLPLIMPEEVVETTPSPPAEQGAAAASRRVSAAPPPPLPVPPAPPAPPPMPAAVALSDDDGAADTAALSRAEPVLTETMAELYLKQGHPEDALRVYHALLVQRPQDARLRARVDALTPGGKREAGGPAGESLPAFLKRILSGRSQTIEPTPVAVSPLESAFAVASFEDESQIEIDAPGEATRPAEDTISLDQVFGEEGEAARGSLSAVESGSPPPASPLPPSSPPAAAEPTHATGGFSFDQFFSPPAAVVDTSAGPGPAPPPRPSGPRARPPAEDEGDLDQFQAWLKGLKS
ncbi:MAG TPA: hypothetical protein VFU41_13500, partial [Gemmatimonadales bacterium]|nr:hypothetical protein [Gemmatimonadales bacterium]